MKMEDNIIQVPIESIVPNRFQPRLQFDEEGLKELSESIRQHGIIQPLVLRRLGDKYEIIAGERRYKASIMAGLKTVPAVISDIDDNASAEIALVENIQRRNLSSIEEAKSYKKLLDRGYMTQEQLAEKLGVSQSSISNKMRLLNLAPEVQEALLGQKISERHARSLLNIPIEEQSKWLDKIIRERLTVRQLDMEIKKVKGDTIEDIPLVTPKKDVNTIMANAVDLNVEPLPKEPETLETDDKEPFIIPNKFFNFLEDESANMKMDVPVNNYANNSISENIETLDDLLNEENNTPSSMSTSTDTIISTPVEEPAVKEQSIEEITPTFDPMNQNPQPNQFMFMNQNDTPATNNIIEEIDTTPENSIIDPMDSVIQLEPNYNEYIDEKRGVDLKTAINEIRDLVNNLNERGFRIALDEIDLDDKYQIKVEINKNN